LSFGHLVNIPRHATIPSFLGGIWRNLAEFGGINRKGLIDKLGGIWRNLAEFGGTTIKIYFDA